MNLVFIGKNSLVKREMFMLNKIDIKIGDQYNVSGAGEKGCIEILSLPPVGKSVVHIKFIPYDASLPNLDVGAKIGCFNGDWYFNW